MVWHVDDLMASCEDDFELTKFSCYMGRIYGPTLSMHLGKKHDYLGVDMEFCDDGALEVSMVKYLINVIDKFPELIKEERQLWSMTSYLWSETKRKQRNSMNNNRWLFTTQWRNYCSWQREQGEIFRWQWRF